MIHEGLVFLCMADDSLGKSLPYGYLAEVGSQTCVTQLTNTFKSPKALNSCFFNHSDYKRNFAHAVLSFGSSYTYLTARSLAIVN